MMAIRARANTSLPEPGPPCTTNSTGRDGVKAAKAGRVAAAATRPIDPARNSRLNMTFLQTGLWLLYQAAEVLTRHARACPGHPRLAETQQGRRGWPGQARPRRAWKGQQLLGLAL